MNPKPARPQPGTITQGEKRIPVCPRCGYLIDDGLCDDECPLFGEPRTAKEIIYAVYKVTNEFLRDEGPAE
jgi:hypothetical protein